MKTGSFFLKYSRFIRRKFEQIQGIITVRNPQQTTPCFWESHISIQYYWCTQVQFIDL